jgi:hypothetical protein
MPGKSLAALSKKNRYGRREKGVKGENKNNGLVEFY